MKKVNLFFTVVLLAITVCISSCKKDENKKLGSDEGTTLLQDDAQAADAVDEVDAEIDDVTNSKSDLKSAVKDSTSLDGREVEWKTNNDGSHEATITFTNFVNPKAKALGIERVKNGTIHVVVTGKRVDNTFKRVVTFTNFNINGNKIEGTKTVEKIAAFTYKITMVGGKITFEDSTFITCDYTRTRTMVEGMSTPLFIWDDAYTLEGTASGINRKGNSYTKEITKAVKIFTKYKFPVEGAFTLTVGENTLSLDFGDGTRDAKATVTINGVSKEISLRTK